MLATTAPAQHDRLLGEVRDGAGNAVADARVRILPLPPASVPWLEAVCDLPAPLETSTDARGRFTCAHEGRAAIWIDAAGVGAFVATAAPGVPVLAELAPLAAVQLPDDARGAHLRIDGVTVGWMAGTRLELPAGALDLLVEGATLPFVAACGARAGDALRIERPTVAPARLLGVAPTSLVSLSTFPRRQFAPDADGVVILPIANRPSLSRVVTRAGDDRAFEEVWLEPGDQRELAPATPTWQPLRVLDPVGQPVIAATVTTIRAGPGLPTVSAVSVTDDDGRARFCTGIDRGVVVVVADGFALQSLRPIDLAADRPVTLAPAHRIRLRVVDELGLALPSASITTGGVPAVDRRVRTDLRGEAVLDRLPAGPLVVAVDHPDRVPMTATVDVPTSGTVELVLERGLEIRGQVLCPDRAVLDDVLVEARRPFDPDFRPRRVAVAADGTFVVRGLPDLSLDLFAWRVERGVTWSGALVAVVPGGPPVELIITCDDPQPGGR